MKSTEYPLFPAALCVLALFVVTLAPSGVRADENPALWKHETTGNFAAVLDDLKSGLEAAQFVITGEEDLAKALETNKNILGADHWNTIGFERATAVHFCSLVFNHEVFNTNMDWAILCPFKVVAYTMKENPETVTILLTRPSYLLENDPDGRGKAVGQKMETRILDAIMEAVPKQNHAQRGWR